MVKGPVFGPACIVVQNDRGNAASPTTVVVPLSDARRNQRRLPILVFVSSLELGSGGKDPVVHCEQIRTIDTSARVNEIVGHAGVDVMEWIQVTIAISLGLSA